jgi:hypothetical protein
MRKLAVSAQDAEPVRPTTVNSATPVVAIFPSRSGALDSSYEDGARMSSWNARAW